MKGIEKRLQYYAPKENKDVPAEYQEAAKVHREAAEMSNILRAYEQADESGKDSIRKGFMLGKIKEYYESLYKNGKENEKLKEQNEALLRVSLTWAARNPKMCEGKFVQLAARKMQELKRKIAGLTKEEYNKLAETNPDNLKERISKAIPAYLMAALSPESLKSMYVDQWAEEARNGGD